MRLQMKGLCDVWLRYRVNSWVMAVRGAAIRIALTVQKLSLGCRPDSTCQTSLPLLLRHHRPLRRTLAQTHFWRRQFSYWSEPRMDRFWMSLPLCRNHPLWRNHRACFLAGFLVFHDSAITAAERYRALWSISVDRWFDTRFLVARSFLCKVWHVQRGF